MRVVLGLCVVVLFAACTRDLSRPASPTRPPPVSPTPPPPVPESTEPTETANVKAKQLVDDASVAFARGQNEEAISLAQQAARLATRPGLLNRASATIVLAHCFSGHVDEARKLASRLEGAWKSQVREGCRSRGIKLD